MKSVKSLWMYHKCHSEPHRKQFVLCTIRRTNCKELLKYCMFLNKQQSTFHATTLQSYRVCMNNISMFLGCENTNKVAPFGYFFLFWATYMFPVCKSNIFLNIKPTHINDVNRSLVELEYIVCFWIYNIHSHNGNLSL